MLIDDLIEKLYELKKEYGNLEVILWTQRDAWSYDEHAIAEVCHDGDESIAIAGEEKTEEKPEEKKYRPYTLMEFIDKFTVGRPIKYRSKGETGREHYLMLLGFWLTTGKDQTIPYISIGNFKYTLQELFEDYEWQEHYTEDFKPFGVVEDKE